MKHSKVWSLVIPIALVVILLAIPVFVTLSKMGFFTSAPTAEVTMTAPESAPELAFVADYDYDPYSYLNEDGTPNGMDVEIAYELANRLGMRPKITFGTWSECKERIKNGEADVLLGLEIFVDGTATGTLKSIPVGSDTLSIIGRDSINDAAALSEKRVGISIGSALLNLFKLNCEYVEFFTYSEMLEALEKGELDYAICHASVASRIIEKNGYSLKPSLVLMESFPTLGIRQDEPELQVKINHILEDMSSDGTISALRTKWIITNVQNKTFGDVFRNNEAFFIVYGILAIVLLAGYFVAAVTFRASLERKKSLETVQTQQKSLKNALDAATKEQLRTNLLHDIIHSGKWTFYVNGDDEITGGDVSDEANTIIRNDVPADGRSWLDIVYPDDRENADHAFHAAIRDHSCMTPYDVNYRMKDRNGEYRWFHSAGRMIRNEDGSGEFFGIHVDITSQIEEQLKQQNLLEEARVAADAANKAKTNFLFNMSHDIRTPMNAILGYTDIAINHIDETERVGDSLKKIKASGGHLLSLINDILEMSRIEAGKLEIVSAPVNVYEVSEGIIHMSQALASTKDIIFKAKICDLKNPYVYADELHTNQIIINLISNAIKYTNPGGTVDYRIEQTSDPADGRADYRVTVKDNGIGMSEEFQKHLFESFVREQTLAVSKQEGAGLGLAIVKRLVDHMGGSIHVKSKQGEGSEFTVELPLEVVDDAGIEAYEASRRFNTEVGDLSSLKGKRVLLVEDNEMNREIATEILEESGLIVESAEDGALAVKKVLECGADRYDFILMDIQMPVMDGYEATAEIRKLPGGDKIPVIALSANAFIEDVEKSLSAGMNAHVAKPINVKELFAALAKFL